MAPTSNELAPYSPTGITDSITYALADEVIRAKAAEAQLQKNIDAAKTDAAKKDQATLDSAMAYADTLLSGAAGQAVGQAKAYTDAREAEVRAYVDAKAATAQGQPAPAGEASTKDYTDAAVAAQDRFASIADAAGKVQIHAAGETPLEIVAGSNTRIEFDAERKRVTIGQGNSSNLFIYQQADPADTWTIRHGLPNPPTSIRVVLADGRVIEPAITVDPGAPWVVTLDFAEPTTGTAYLGTVPAPPAQVTVFEQTYASDVWTVEHSIGCVPSFRWEVDGYGWLEPAIDVMETAPFTITLTFGIQVSGRVYLSS